MFWEVLLKDYQSPNHTRWDCKYDVVFIPKRRKRAVYGSIRKHLGKVFHELAKQKEPTIVEGHLRQDHIHMCVSIPPKYAVSNVIGYIKGKSAISIARTFVGRRRNFTGENFWARGYYVSTVGLGRVCQEVHPGPGGRRCPPGTTQYAS
jgi:putative transposase